MKISLQIIDHRPTRSANIALRALKLLGEELRAHAYAVNRYPAHADWSGDTESGDVLLVLVHYDDDVRHVIEEVNRRAVGSPGRRRLVVVYSGDTLSEPTKQGLRRRADGEWLRVCPAIVAGEEDGDLAGMVNPPVEEYLCELLDLPVRQALSRGSFTGQAEGAALRHDLVNAISPLRMMVAAAVAGATTAVDPTEEWLAARAILDRLKPQLPGWFALEMAAIDAVLPKWRAEPSERTGVASAIFIGISKMEQHALSIGREVTDWDEIAQSFERFAGRPVRVLWIDDDPAWARVLEPVMRRYSIAVTHTANVEGLIRSPERVSEYDAILMDIVMHGHGRKIADTLTAKGISLGEHVAAEADDARAGIGLLRLLQFHGDMTPMFMFTARESASVVQACTTFGAKGFFTKARCDVLDIITAIHREARAAAELRDSLRIPQNTNIIVAGEADPLMKTFAVVEQLKNTNVLLFGETGSGKEEIARELHARSIRRGRHFAHVDCNKLQGARLIAQSELFGHVRGAFTGAEKDRAGAFQSANGGTVFIDEIQNLDLELQGQLLRVLNSQTIQRVGEQRDIPVDVRVITATNVNLKAEVDRGKFRGDLLNRLGQPIRIPSIQTRAAVIGPLVTLLAERRWLEEGHTPPTISADAVAWLRARALAGQFKGNFRDLNVLLERVLVSSAISEIDRATLETAANAVNVWADEGEHAAVQKAAALLLGEIEPLAEQFATQRPAGRRESLVPDILRALEWELWRGIIERFAHIDGAGQVRDQQRIARLLGMTPGALRQKIRTLRAQRQLPGIERLLILDDDPSDED